ncbi:MAG: hypothetical protein M0Z87_00205 [Actinomycetota bacterium]|nr:hypothetical protein [Actinomycetota bacterium]
MLTALAIVTAVTAVLAVVLGVLLAKTHSDLASERRSRAQAEEEKAAVRAETEAAERALSSASTRLIETQTALEAETLRADQAEIPLHEAERRAALATQAMEAWGEAALALERLGRHRAWSVLAGPSLAPPWSEGEAEAPGMTLLHGIEVEIESIREEVGTPGQLEVVLGEKLDLTPAAAALGLVAIRELLRRLAPGCEELQVHVDGSPVPPEIAVQAVGVRSLGDVAGTASDVMAAVSSQGWPSLVAIEDPETGRVGIELSLG